MNRNQLADHLRLPLGVSYDEGALLEPLAVAVHACRRAGVQPGSTCTIIGAGPIGLLCAIAARNAGCVNIAIADVVADRVAFAVEKKFADTGFVVSSKRAGLPEESLTMARDTAKSIAGLTLANGSTLGPTDYTFECTGIEVCAQSAIFVSERMFSERSHH